MNQDNYVTLEQSKKMKELGFPQDRTDCVWQFLPHEGMEVLLFRDSPDFHASQKYYAAPNAQEVSLGQRIKSGRGFTLVVYDKTLRTRISFGQSHIAQSCCKAWLWERENKPYGIK